MSSILWTAGLRLLVVALTVLFLVSVVTVAVAKRDAAEIQAQSARGCELVSVEPTMPWMGFYKRTWSCQ